MFRVLKIIWKVGNGYIVKEIVGWNFMMKIQNQSNEKQFYKYFRKCFLSYQLTARQTLQQDISHERIKNFTLWRFKHFVIKNVFVYSSFAHNFFFAKRTKEENLHKSNPLIGIVTYLMLPLEVFYFLHKITSLFYSCISGKLDSTISFRHSFVFFK